MCILCTDGTLFTQHKAFSMRKTTRTCLVMWTICGFSAQRRTCVYSAQTVPCLLSTKHSVCGKQLGHVLLCGQSVVSLHSGEHVYTLHRRYPVYSAQMFGMRKTTRTCLVMWTICGFSAQQRTCVYSAQTVPCLLSTKHSVCGNTWKCSVFNAQSLSVNFTYFNFSTKYSPNLIESES